MESRNNHFSFLVIGKSQDSSEGGTGFKRYIGLASSHIVAWNPTKEKLDELLGYETKKAPEYFGEDEQGKFARIMFVFKTDPESNKGIEATCAASITLRNQPAYNSSKDKVQVIDNYGNFTWADVEIAKNKGKIEYAQKLDKYGIARVGECVLTDLLRKFLNVPDAYDYKDGSWIKKSEEKAQEGMFRLEHIEDYIKGDFSEIKEAMELQPNNKVKLLWGVQNKDGKQFQTVLLRENLILNNASGAKGYAKLAENLAKAKQHASSDSNFANTEYKVQELAEYSVVPTNLDKPAEASEGTSSSGDDMPW